jgi:valyl-tRNA synthetase
MIMFGLEFTGQAPFHTVYLHGLIRAEGGVKMSKVKGNVQDPLELIAEYGTDALRLGVSIGITPGNDFTLTPTILDARRDFVNKLWNIGRLVMARTTPQQRRRALAPAEVRANAPLVERWISSRLGQIITEVTRLLGEFNFGEAGRVIHDFIWDEVADWYVEAYKILSASGQADGALLAQVYEKTLRLLHPFAPFVTEELWQRLTTGTADRPISIMMAQWPEADGAADATAEAEWSDLMALTRAVRTLRADYRIEPSNTIPATIVARGAHEAELWRQNAELVGALPGARLKPIQILSDGVAPELAEGSLAAVAGGAELLIPAAGLFDVQTELKRTATELADAQKRVHSLEARLGGEFGRKAPPEVVEADRERLAEQRERLSALERRQQTLTRLSGGSTA